jgi:sugar lactone lactonase YvrE
VTVPLDLPVLNFTPALQYRQAHVIAGQFTTAVRGLAVDSSGRLYAAGDSYIKVYDRSGQLARQWPTARPPHSVAVAPDGSVYAGETGQIEIFASTGKPRTAWRNEASLGRVTAIGFTSDSVLAADAADRAIRRFDRAGRFLNNIGKENRVNGFLIPNGVVDFDVDAEGVIHAANPGKHRIERYTPDGRLLGHIGRFDGLDPAGFPGCCNPTNVAVRDRIFVTEKAGPRAKVYDFAGKLLAVIAVSPFDPNCKNMSIAVDPRGRVWVADTVKLCIFAFDQVTV